MSTPGRNDPCPCGSGKKYKRCCLEKDQAAEREKLRLADLEDPDDAELTVEDIRNAVKHDMQWSNLLHSLLAQHLISNMEPFYEESVILEAVAFWNEFSKATQPIYRKLGAYCAALEYLVVQGYGFDVTQSDLAEKYNVSTATISKRYQELLDFAENYYDERSLDDDPILPHPSDKRKRKAHDAKEQAQDLLYAAADEWNPKRRAELAKQALELYPDSPDAYDILAGLEENPQRALALLKKGIEAGERDLGKAFIEENKGHFWGIHETRPYMRVKYAYAELSFAVGNSSEAAKHLEHILELNPNDNMGARHLLLSVYLDMDRLREAERLLDTYREESSASVAYDRIVLEYKKNGFSSKLTMTYRNALHLNKHIPDYLLGRKKLPNTLPDYINPGGDNEAVHYVATHSALWVKLPELLRWMDRQTK